MSLTTAFRRPELAADIRAFLAAPHRLLVDGRWTDAVKGGVLPVEDPGTGEVITQVAAATAEDVDLAVAAARRAFERGPWGRMKPDERAKVLWRIADLIEARADLFARLEALDNGKPVVNARKGDVPGTVAQFRYMAGFTQRLNGETMKVSNPGEWHAYTVHEPVGVVAQIVPWNFPLVMIANKVAPALAAGCTVVLKPAEQTPLSALLFGEIVAEAGLPEGVVNILTGYGETAGAALAAHPGVDKVAFTGSTAVGKMIVRAAAGNLKRVSLELGGKSPAIVFPDADIDQAVAGTSHAIFYNQGECCTAASRLFAHESIFDRVVEGMAAEAGRLRVGHGLNEDVDLGPLVSAEQQKRVRGYIDAGRADAAEVVFGGDTHDGSGYFVGPTILARVRPDMAVAREEIFGPVVCVQPFGDDDLDAIAAFANDTDYGLQASIWTTRLSTAHRLASRIRSGTVCVNNHHFGDPSWPFGGMKQSGWGREMGSEVMRDYTEVKAVSIRL